MYMYILEWEINICNRLRQWLRSGGAHKVLKCIAEGSASKLLTCMCSKDWSVSPSNHNQIMWLMPCGKVEKQPFQMYPSLHQHLCSIWRYSSNTGQIQNTWTLLEVTVHCNAATLVQGLTLSYSKFPECNWHKLMSCCDWHGGRTQETHPWA